MAYDLIEEGRNGFLVPERDEHALYKKLKLLVGDEKLVRQMGAESTRIINERYQYAGMVNGFGSAVAYVCERRAKHRSQMVTVYTRAVYMRAKIHRLCYIG